MAFINIATSLLLQLVTVVCAFIIPRLIIVTFGSDVNGLLSSIVNILSYISLLEAGVGSVVRTALYQPLATNDTNTINGILRASQKFFRVIAFIYIGYLAAVAVIYPLILTSDFDFSFVFFLVLIVGASIFVNYFFSLQYKILLLADQKLYITSAIEIFTIIINTILIVILTKLGAGIHVVRLFSASIFIFRAVILNWYIKRKYTLNLRCQPNNALISQKWDSFTQYIAYFFRVNSDVLLLTIFTNILEISVYSVYKLVVSGMESIIYTFSRGIEASFGDMIAKNETENLKRVFNLYEFTLFTIATVLFTCVGLLIIPFITLYTKGVADVNYIRPTFAFILIAASVIMCIRQPYLTIISAAGHFRQTKGIAIIEAAVNIILSIVFVNLYGLNGVAIATVIAVLIRTVYHVVYLSKHIIFRSVWKFCSRCIVSILAVAVTVIILRLLPHINVDNYYEWFLYALEVFWISVSVVLMADLIFYFRDLKNCVKIMKKVIKRK